MSAAKPADAGSQPFAVQRESLRDTAKWVMGTAGALLAGIIAALPLARLADLSIDVVSGAAIAGLVGAALGGYLLLQGALAVLTINVRTRVEIFRGGDKRTREIRASTESMLREEVPADVDTFAKLDAAYEAARALTWKGEASPTFDAARNYMNFAVDLFLFNEVRQRFARLTGRLRWALPLSVTGLLTFVWAAGVSSEPEPFEHPVPYQIAWSPQNDVALRASGLGSTCYKPSVSMIGVGALSGGRIRALSAPSPGCPSEPFVITDRGSVIASRW